MLSKDAALTAFEELSPDDFYKPAHGEMFTLMAELYAKGEPVDAVLMGDALRRQGKLEEYGGKAYLFTLVSSVPTPGSVGHYARIVAEHSRLRRVIVACEEVVDEAFSLPEDVDEALDRAEARVFDAVRASDRYDPATMAELVTDAMREWEAGPREFVGLPTGLPDLDAVIGGLESGDLITIGAATSVGKTALACKITREAVKHGPVLYVSLEMPRSAMFRRFLSAESSVDAKRLKRWDLRDYEVPTVTDALARLSGLPLVIDDKPQSTVFDVRARARRLAARRGEIALVVVDYLQLLQPPRGRKTENRTQEVSDISRGLKILAGELNVPVLALSQLSRKVDDRMDKRPLLGDLRESGSIEQDSSVVMLVSREDVYNRRKENYRPSGIAEIDVAKSRNGALGVVKVAFSDSLARFDSLAYGSTS
jgi:replicative DNA helicase